MVTKKPKGLGRGLEALLGPKVAEVVEKAQAAEAGLPSSLPLSELVPGVYQPRTRMDEGALYELAESIKAQGIMQPILVRRLVEGDNAGRYEIIAGERRFRAARLAGLDSVPVLVRDVPNEAAAAMALIENIQREDLNPLEEAQGLLVREAELFHQPLQALGFFQRIEVFALDVLDERHGGGGLVGHVAHQHGHGIEARQSGGAKPPLARDDFVFARVVATRQAPHQNGLHDALGLDRLGQLVESALVHAGARLVHAGHHVIQAQAAGQPRIGGLRLFSRLGHLGAQQCFESAAEALGFFGDHVRQSFKRVCSRWCPSGQSARPDSALMWPRAPPSTKRAPQASPRPSARS